MGAGLCFVGFAGNVNRGFSIRNLENEEVVLGGSVVKELAGRPSGLGTSRRCGMAVEAYGRAESGAALALK